LYKKIESIDERKIIAVVCLVGAVFLGVLGICSTNICFEIGLVIFSIVFSAVASWILSTLHFEKKDKINERRIAKSIDNMCKALIESLDADIEYYEVHDFQSKLYSYRNQVVAIKDTTYGIGIENIDMNLYDEYGDKQREIAEHLKKVVSK